MRGELVSIPTTYTLLEGKAHLASVVIGNYIYIIGGDTEVAYLDIIEGYIVDEYNNLTPLEGLPTLLTPRAYVSAAISNNYIYIIGGYISGGYNNDYLDTIECFYVNPDGSLSNITCTALLSSPRSDFSVVTIGNYLYVFGGEIDGYPYQTSTIDGYSINPVSGELTPLIGLPTLLQNKGYTSAIAYNNNIYVFGGYGGGTDKSTIEGFQVQSDGSLTRINNLPSLSSPRDSASVALIDNYIYVFGGSYEDYVDSIECFQITSDTLSPISITTTLDTAKESFTALSINNYIYVMGGQDGQDGDYLDTIEIFDLLESNPIQYTIETNTKIKRVLVDEIEVQATDPWILIIVPTNTNTPTQEEVEEWLAYTNSGNHFTFAFEEAEEGVNWSTQSYYGTCPFPINNHCITIFRNESPFAFEAGGCAISEKGTVAQWYESETNQVLGLRILHEMLHALGIDSDQMINNDFTEFSQYLEYLRHPLYKEFKNDKYTYENDPNFQEIYYEWLIEINKITKYVNVECYGNANHTIHVDHYPHPTINYTLSSGGTGSSTGTQSITWGTSTSRSFTVNAGYKIKKLIVNGRAINDLSALRTSGTTYYFDFYNIIRDQIIHVEFIEISDFTISNNVSLLDFFATFEFKTFIETLAFATSLFPATIFTEYLYYTQDEVPLNPGFDEYGKYIVAANINERANIVISTHNELGDLTVLFPSFSENAHFYTINEITEFEEIILYESFPTHDD